jgi:hypothetical protein
MLLAIIGRRIHLLQQQTIVFHNALDFFMANSTSYEPHAFSTLKGKHVPMESVGCIYDTPPWAVPKNRKIIGAFLWDADNFKVFELT